MRSMNTPHPLAKIFAPLVFSSLALLGVAMAVSSAQADEPTTAAETTAR